MRLFPIRLLDFSDAAPYPLWGVPFRSGLAARGKAGIRKSTLCHTSRVTHIIMTFRHYEIPRLYTPAGKPKTPESEVVGSQKLPTKIDVTLFESTQTTETKGKVWEIQTHSKISSTICQWFYKMTCALMSNYERNKMRGLKKKETGSWEKVTPLPYTAKQKKGRGTRRHGTTRHSQGLEEGDSVDEVSVVAYHEHAQVREESQQVSPVSLTLQVGVGEAYERRSTLEEDWTAAYQQVRKNFPHFWRFHLEDCLAVCRLRL